MMGSLAHTWGDINGFFRHPRRIAVGMEGEIFVADRCNHRIQVFQPCGKHLRSIGKHGTRPGQFNHPVGVAITNNMLIVSESE